MNHVVYLEIGLNYFHQMLGNVEIYESQFKENCGYHYYYPVRVLHPNLSNLLSWIIMKESSSIVLINRFSHTSLLENKHKRVSGNCIFQP